MAKHRLSLTKTDRATTAGLELLGILQEVSDDGQVSPGEVERLRGWLTDNPTADFPARDYLAGLITEILRDGVVTDPEADALQSAVERVLPPDLRVLATARRRERRATERAEAKADKPAQHQRAQEKRELNRPLDTADFMVAGATRPEYRSASDTVSPGETVVLMREPTNPYDQNAIQVISSAGLVLGYVPREFAADLAPVMDNGARQTAVVKKVLETAKGFALPVVLARFYSSDSAMGAVPVGDLTATGRLPRAAHGRLDSVGGVVVPPGATDSPRSRVPWVWLLVGAAILALAGWIGWTTSPV